MWIFTSDSFLSVVDKGDLSGKTLLVRGRRARDIERVFPDAVVTEGAGSDYRFRARVDREVVAQAVAKSVRDIKYPNFKASVKEIQRHAVLMEVWSVMCQFQEDEQ